MQQARLVTCLVRALEKAPVAHVPYPRCQRVYFGSALYHDIIWYNLRGKVVRNFQDNTEWGRLFKSYN